MAAKDLAKVGDGYESITSEVTVYEFSSMGNTINFIVFDTPGLSDTRGRDDLKDEDIKTMIHKAILRKSKETSNRVDALLIFATCEDKKSGINITLRPLRSMFKDSFSKSSICMLTGCGDKKLKKKKEQLQKECLANGIPYIFWDEKKSFDDQSLWNNQYKDLIDAIFKVKPLNLFEEVETALEETSYLNWALKYLGIAFKSG